MSVSVVINGLVNVEKRFTESINNLAKLKKEGILKQIVFSTWYGEIDKYPGLRNFLSSKDIETVESKPPKISGISSLYQMRSFHLGMDVVNDKESMVFKTRPDLYIHESALRKIIALELNLKGPCQVKMKRKVWVPWFEITKPFYLADECFFGHYQDLYKHFINYDLIYDNYYNIDSGLTHIRRFIHPFVEGYPQLKKFLRYFAVTAHGTNQRFKVLNFYKKLRTYKSLLVLYYRILDRYFEIGLKDEKNYIIFRKWSQNYIELPTSNCLYDVFHPRYSWDPSLGHIYGNNSAWLKNVLDKINIDDVKLMNFDFCLNEANRARKIGLEAKKKTEQEIIGHSFYEKIIYRLRRIIKNLLF